MVNKEYFGVLCRVGRNPYPTHCFNLLTDNTNKAAKIQCALFKGTTRDIFIDRKEFDGPIYKQVDNAYNFVLRHIDMGAEIESVYRNDDYELPISAIREIIANAVLHRSYLDKSCVQVCIYDDRLEVSSPGMLYGGLDIETAKKGKSSCRNEAIAEAFHYMRIVEAWGTGLPRILNRCKEYDLPEPLFEEFGDGFKVTLFRKVSNNQEKMSGVDIKQIKNERSLDENDKNERSLSEVLSEVLSTSEYNKVEKIIHYLEINRSITPKIAEEITGKSAPTVRRYLKMLVETGYVNIDGKTNNVRYKI